MKKFALCMIEGIWGKVSIVAYDIIHYENLNTVTMSLQNSVAYCW